MDDVRFTAKVIEEIDNGPDVLKSLQVGVFKVRDGGENQVGTYTRNYDTLYRAFYYFE